MWSRRFPFILLIAASYAQCQPPCDKHSECTGPIDETGRYVCIHLYDDDGNKPAGADDGSINPAPYIFGVIGAIVLCCVCKRKSDYDDAQKAKKAGGGALPSAPYVAMPPYNPPQVANQQPPQQMDVQVPPGYPPGSIIQVVTPNGQQFAAQVPQGVGPGTVIRVPIPRTHSAGVSLYT